MLCSKCHTEFEEQLKKKRDSKWCPECWKKYRTNYHKERMLNDEAYCLKYKNYQKKYSKKDKVKQKRKIYEKLYYQSRAIQSKNRNDNRKLEVLTHYSDGLPTCNKCGFIDIRALSIDHINSGGTKHRKELGGAGQSIYKWLQDNSYPKEYQVLCMN